MTSVVAVIVAVVLGMAAVCCGWQSGVRRLPMSPMLFKTRRAQSPVQYNRVSPSALYFKSTSRGIPKISPSPASDGSFNFSKTQSALNKDADIYAPGPIVNVTYDRGSVEYKTMLQNRQQAQWLRKSSAAVLPIVAATGFAIVTSKNRLHKIAGSFAGAVTGFLLKRAIDRRAADLEYEAEVLDSDLEQLITLPDVVLRFHDEVKQLPGKLIDYDLPFFEKLAYKHRVPQRQLFVAIIYVLKEAINQVIDDAPDVAVVLDLLDFIERLKCQKEEIAGALLLSGIDLGLSLERDSEGLYKMYTDEQLSRASLLAMLTEKSKVGFGGYLGKRIHAALGFFLEEDIQAALSYSTEQVFRQTVQSILTHPLRFQKEDFEELKDFLLISPKLSSFSKESMDKIVVEMCKHHIDQQLQASLSSFDQRAFELQRQRLREEQEQAFGGEDNDDEDLGEDEDEDLPVSSEQDEDSTDGESSVDVARKLEEDELAKAQKRHVALHSSLRDSAATSHCARVLSLPVHDMDVLVETETTPLFTQACFDILSRVQGNPQQSGHFAELIKERMNSLQITPRAAQSVILTSIRRINEEFLAQISKVHKVSGEDFEQTFKTMQSYATVYQSLALIVKTVLPDVQAPIPHLPFATPLRLSLFEHKEAKEQMKVDRQMRSSKRSSSVSSRSQQEAEKNAIVTEMLQLEQEQQATIRRVLRAPRIVAVVQQLLNEGLFHVHAKTALQKVLRDNDIEAEDWKATAVEFYQKELESIAQRHAIPSEKDLQRLKSIRSFLDCDEQLIQSVHFDIFGEKFLKALRDSVQASGGLSIAREYVDGLERLRSRLMLTPHHAQLLLTSLLQERFPQQLLDLVDLFKCETDPMYKFEKQRNETLAKQKKMAEGEEVVEDRPETSAASFGFALGKDAVVPTANTRLSSSAKASSSTSRAEAPTSFMKEMLNLAHSIRDSYKVFNIDVLADAPAVKLPQSTIENSQKPKPVEKELSAEAELELVPIDEDEDAVEDDADDRMATSLSLVTQATIHSLPLTAADFVPEDTLKDMFKHFLVCKLTENDVTLRTRYRDVEKLFAKLLGLTDDKSIDVIKEVVAFETYTKLLRHVLKTKDVVDENDVQQFAIIVANLPLKEEVATKVFDDASLLAMASHVEDLMEGGDEDEDAPPKLSAQDARRLRSQIHSMGFDMREDLAFSEDLIAMLFAMEIQEMVEQGREQEFAQLQESYGLSAESATAILEAACHRYATQLMSIAMGHARKYKESDCVAVVSELLRFTQYIVHPIEVDGNIYTDKDVSRLISFYLASVDEDDASEDDNNKQSVTATERETVADRLREMIVLNRKFVAPEFGNDGLMGGADSLTAGLEERSKNSWAWG